MRAIVELTGHVGNALCFLRLPDVAAPSFRR